MVKALRLMAECYIRLMKSLLLMLIYLATLPVILPLDDLKKYQFELYMVIFKNVRDKSQFTNLAKQFMPNHTMSLNQMQSSRENRLRVFTSTVISSRINMLEIIRSIY